MDLGPDAARYLAAANGEPVSRPFHIRWLLPKLLGIELGAWRLVWLLSWPLLAVSTVAWRVTAGDPFWVAVAAAGLLCGLPGILGPHVSIPVQADLPSTALAVTSAWLIVDGHPARIVAGVCVATIAGAIRETAPVVAALTAWSWWPLIGLVAPVVAMLVLKPGPDPLGPKFDHIAAHPIRSALAYHEGRWRDGWLLVAPWGACLAGLVGADWRIALVLAVAYGQLLVATDTVRLFQHVAGPTMAAAAANVIPVAWMPLAVVLHMSWFRRPERI